MSMLAAAWAFFIDSLQTILIAFVIFIIIWLFIFKPFQVKGDSMFPNYHEDEYILTNLYSKHFQNYKRGDVIVFKAPKDFEKDYIKRIIAIAGDTVMVKDNGISLNGKKLDESKYLQNTVNTYPGEFMRENQSYTVQPNEYIVMGDNRLFSSDSRSWGTITKDDIIGQSFFVYWPLNHMHVIKNPFEK